MDDDRLILTTLSTALVEAGYRVTISGSAEGALKLAAEAAFDLAIVDWKLPGIGGAGLVERLLERHGLHSVILSAHSEKDAVANCVRGGALGYLVKPISSERMVPGLEVALARARDIASLRDTQGKLETALTGERDISVAVGLLMVRENLSSSAAFESLRREARARRIKLSHLARDLIIAADKERGEPVPEREI